MIFFGIATGTLFAIAYTICLGRVGNLRPRTLAPLVAASGFLGVYLVPFVKYPANHPQSGIPTRSPIAAGCTCCWWGVRWCSSSRRCGWASG